MAVMHCCECILIKAIARYCFLQLSVVGTGNEIAEVFYTASEIHSNKWNQLHIFW